MAGALAAGFILGICAALLREATDERIQNLDEFQNSGPEMPLAFLPYHASSTRKRLAASRSAAPSIYLPEPLAGTPSTASLPEPLPSAMIAASAPRAAYTEALRSLRTTLMQRGYRDGHPPQVMVITSSVPGEGKSMLSINLAIVYAQRGKRVLLVDGDLRTPVLHQRLALSNERGLGDLLTQRENEAGLKPQKLMLDARMSLDVIAAGSPTSYPTELLASEEMEALLKTWRASYDYIFVDGAPLLPVTDSAVLSRYADFTLVVARHNVTDRRLLPGHSQQRRRAQRCPHERRRPVPLLRPRPKELLREGTPCVNSSASPPSCGWRPLPASRRKTARRAKARGAPSRPAKAS
jgi:succinoglycan biosynthesis transport protein ExoP